MPPAMIDPYQRGQGVNMNLVGPFRGSGYFRLLPPDQPAAIADVRRFALHTGASLKAHLDDPSGPLLPIPTHRQGFRQKREVVSLLRRAGYGAIAPVKLSEELKAMVNRKKQALVAAGQSRRRIPTTAAIEEWLDQVIAEDPLWGWVFAMIATYGLRPHEVWHIDGLPDADGLITIGVAARHIKVTKTGFRAAVPLPPAWVEIAPAEGRRHAYAIRARETTTWSYADVAAVMGHSTEVHRRTYLSEISGEQTKAAMVRRLLGEAA
jgi:integrase